MLLLGMYKHYRWQHLTAKGDFWHWCGLSGVPLFHCTPDCVATLEKWGLASKSCLISLFLSSLIIPLSHSWFIPLPLSQPFVAPADLAGRWDTGMVSLLNVLYFCSPGKSHPSPVGCQSGKNHSGMALVAPCGEFGGGESLAAFPPHVSGLHYIMFTWKKNKCVFLVILQNISHLTAFRSWLSWAFWGTGHWLLTGCSLLQSFLMETENLLSEETWKALCK